MPRVSAQERRRIAVTGATGRVGHHVVDLLQAGGNEVVPVSRATGVDVVTGDGLAEALADVECVVDAASCPSPDQQSATAFFTAAARNLQKAAERAGVQRIVVVSIIGCDRFNSGYNAAKVVHEWEIRSGPVPVRILRAAQFHEFVPQLIDWGRNGEVINVPRMRTQLVAARTVAETLADLATDGESESGAGSSDPISEIAGPRTEELVEMASLFVSQRGDPARIEEGSDPSDPDRELYETDGLLPGPGATLAGPTFEEWLESTE
jgi:uncharacterized protein YbjT (DUF2867 family)